MTASIRFGDEDFYTIDECDLSNSTSKDIVIKNSNSVGNIVLKLGSIDSNSSFKIEDNNGTIISSINGDGTIVTTASSIVNPIVIPNSSGTEAIINPTDKVNDNILIEGKYLKFDSNTSCWLGCGSSANNNAILLLRNGVESGERIARFSADKKSLFYGDIETNGDAAINGELKIGPDSNNGGLIRTYGNQDLTIQTGNNLDETLSLKSQVVYITASKNNDANSNIILTRNNSTSVEDRIAKFTSGSKLTHLYGDLFIEGNCQFPIDKMNDIELNNPTAGQVLTFTGSGKWKNETLLNGNSTDYLNAYFDNGSFNAVTATGWNDIFTLVNETVESSGISMNSSTGIITLTGRCRVDYHVIAGDNSGGNSYQNIRILVDGTQKTRATSRAFNSTSYVNLSLSYVVNSGTELKLQFNGASGTNKTILCSVNCSIYNI